MDSTVPAELLELKSRIETWRATRKYVREPIPGELRRDALAMSRRYPASLVRQVLKIDPSRLKKPAAKQPARAKARRKPQAAFFQLPTALTLPELGASSSPPSTAGCRLQLERGDGSRLTLLLEALDPETINRLCADFLRA
ncbi:MAG: hypothetical protein MOB07_29865 [Acidobacteria bacterium]|nr:hypothetical protein [Acidobacteriota bacterium]